MSSDKYIEIKKQISKEPYFLFITATDIETDEFFNVLKPIEGKGKITKITKGYQAYHIGLLGKYNVVHVQCGSMGSISRDASINTVTEALSNWDPFGIVMVGICFGKDPSKQKIGDVLISETITNYESQKKRGDEVIPRSAIPQAGKALLDRFKNMRTWEFEIAKGTKARKIFGNLLTGEKLIDDNNFKSELFSIFKEAIGGDMEAFGVYSAASAKGISEWIVVKGICDWADGNKNENKFTNQKLAANAAASLCLAVFNEKQFSDIKTINGEETGREENGFEFNDDDSRIFSDPASFFNYRVKNAFPGVRGLFVIKDPKKSIERLSILLKQPLSSNKVQDPIWYFRGSSCLSISNFEIVSKTKCIINSDELEIDKIACYAASSYYRDFVYIQTKAEKPIGVYPNVNKEHKKEMALRLGYYYEEYGVFNDYPITRAEYDDDSAVIKGKVINFNNKSKLRVRYLTPYNLIICAKFHPFNSDSGDKFTETGLNHILEKTLSIDQFAKESLDLPKNKHDY